MELNVNDLKNMKRFGVGGNTFNSGGNIYQYNDNILYKIVDEYFFRDEVERNVDYLMNHDVPNTPKIYDKIYLNGNFFGYSMKYLKDTITFRNATYLKIDFDKALGAIQCVYQAIKYLHDRNVLIGDLHLDNVMIDNCGYGYLIDLDYMIFPGDEYKFNKLYDIKYRHDGYRVSLSSKNTDNVRAMICSLSIIFGIDLESKFRNYFEVNLENMYDEFIQSLHIGVLNDYFSRIISGIDVEYFDDFLEDNSSSIKNSNYIYCKKREHLL